MELVWKLLLLLCLILFPLMGRSEEDPGIISDAKKVASTGFKFSSDFYYALRKTHTENLISSPFSLRTVIAMLKLGAKGRTHEEMKKAMNFDMEDANLNEGFSYILKKLQNPDKKYTLDLANGIYAMNNFQIQNHYLNDSERYYNSSLITLDFSDKDQASQINKFVAEKTRNKIQNIIDPGSLDSNTRMILINAVYFSGNWLEPFDPVNTRLQPFFPFLNSTHSFIPTMVRTSTFPFAFVPELNGRAIAIPYKGEKAELVVILPNRGSTLSDMEKRFVNFDLSKIKFIDQRIKLAIPKFRIETTINLLTKLRDMGIKAVFDSEAADLSGISIIESHMNLYVSKAIQKAFIEINEAGTEAAAASAVEIEARSIGLTPPEMFIDRPFYFYIWEKSLRIILFSGAVTKPEI